MFERRDRRAAAEWSRFASHAAHYDLAIVTVVEVYQLAHHGTKALVILHGEPLFRDAWFWWDRVRAGTTVAVALSSGYGPHTHRDGVIYIGGQESGSGVYDSVSARTLRHAQRHHRRAASSGIPDRTSSATPRTAAT